MTLAEEPCQFTGSRHVGGDGMLTLSGFVIRVRGTAAGGGAGHLELSWKKFLLAAPDWPLGITSEAGRGRSEARAVPSEV